MKAQIVCLMFTLLFANSCKSEIQKEKEQNIESSIVKMRTEMDSIQNKRTTENVKPQKELTKVERIRQINEGDKIIGIWEVKNDYYYAIYEIEKYRDKYIGKVHYFNDGKVEYKGKNTKEDYFLDNVIYTNGLYKNGKMYTPDGSNYQVIFKLNNDNELEVKMTFQGSPYTEQWKRQNTL